MTELAIGVIGAGGRMGTTVVQEIVDTEGCALAAAAEAPGHSAIGRDAGEVAGLGALGVSIGADPAAVFGRAEAVIEFALPEATARHVGLAARAGTAHVIGTTGFGAAHEAAIAEAGGSVPVVVAPNMSLAVNILFALTRQVASLLDDRFDIEIVEMHHKHKVDAPSGTALGLGRAAAAGRGGRSRRGFADGAPRPYRRARARRHRLRGPARRRRGGRSHGGLRHRGRTAGARPQGVLAAHLLARRGPCRAVDAGPGAGGLHDGRRAGAVTRRRRERAAPPAYSAAARPAAASRVP